MRNMSTMQEILMSLVKFFLLISLTIPGASNAAISSVSTLLSIDAMHLL
jgi:hypothetical protein